METLWGIDYGKKLSGNTVICERDNRKIHFYQAENNRDADQFILDHIQKHPPRLIFIDAPLTLPGAYHHPERYDNYFFRRCDLELGAMSPMFLGGLTARAIRLKSLAEKEGIGMKETYPKALARKMGLQEHGYRRGKENMEACIALIEESAALKVNKADIRSWHHFDALLALVSGIRYEQRLGYSFGDTKEGLIYI